MKVEIDGRRAVADLAKLATFSGGEPPGVTRIVYSEADNEARAWLKQQCVETGLDVREDAIGNLFARWGGQGLAVGTGSHIDAIPHSGQYDGTVGVLGGLEAIRALKRSGFIPKRAIELLTFISEEPTRYGIGCLGSRMLCGALSAKDAAALTERDAAALETVKLPAGYYSHFVELHIEQGPILEKKGIGLGVVTSIAAPAALRVLIEGEGGHAGAVLMPQRRDAALGAAEIALACESAALATGAVDTVATCGLWEVFPNVANGVPSKVKLELDVRDIDMARRDSVLQKIQQTCEHVAQKRSLKIAVTTLNADAPATCAPEIVAAFESACREEGKSFERMVSRAYHDSLFMSRIAPTGMLFIPCRGGVSHRPDEYASPEDIATGIQVLARTLATLSHDG